MTKHQTCPIRSEDRVGLVRTHAVSFASWSTWSMRREKKRDIANDQDAPAWVCRLGKKPRSGAALSPMDLSTRRSNERLASQASVHSSATSTYKVSMLERVMTNRVTTLQIRVLRAPRSAEVAHSKDRALSKLKISQGDPRLLRRRRIAVRHRKRSDRTRRAGGLREVRPSRVSWRSRIWRIELRKSSKRKSWICPRPRSGKSLNTTTSSSKSSPRSSSAPRTTTIRRASRAKSARRSWARLRTR